MFIFVVPKIFVVLIMVLYRKIIIYFGVLENGYKTD